MHLQTLEKSLKAKWVWFPAGRTAEFVSTDGSVNELRHPHAWSLLHCMTKSPSVRTPSFSPMPRSCAKSSRDRGIKLNLGQMIAVVIHQTRYQFYVVATAPSTSRSKACPGHSSPASRAARRASDPPAPARCLPGCVRRHGGKAAPDVGPLRIKRVVKVEEDGFKWHAARSSRVRGFRRRSLRCERSITRPSLELADRQAGRPPI